MVKKIVFLILITILTAPLKICIAPGLDERGHEENIISAGEMLDGFNVRDELIRLRDSIGYHESRDDWNIVNKIGCIGRFQFKVSTLHLLGYTDVTLKEFKKNPESFGPEIQIQAYDDLVRANWLELKDYSCYIGTVINNVTITKSGLIAAAHLAGAKNVKKYLMTNGRYIYVEGLRCDISQGRSRKRNAKDMNGTSVSDYIKKFQGFGI